MDILVNKKVYLDKVHACWIGKNIGGTMGTPFEGKPDIQDIKGFTSPKGEPLPNDDLDLQLIWLLALEEVGPKAINENVLSWYWRRYIPAIWNEYGVGQNNAAIGITPPMSGELFNEGWKMSNGAWIRSEIWACLAPGFPNIAARYAIMEASIDHGVSDGTAAEIFTAALESMAFVESDIKVLIEKALTYIPEDSRITKSVRLVIDEYEKGTDWKETRELVLKLNADLGFFQAPSNIAYVIIGLLYGQGDMLKSLVYAINCGDDTDCTGATVGAVLGIIGGTESIDKELSDYIGDRIVTKSLDISAIDWRLPFTCTALTDRVSRMMPWLMVANGNYTEYTDSKEAPCVSGHTLDCNGASHSFLKQNPLSVKSYNHWLRSTVTFEGEPRITANGEICFELCLKNPAYTVYQLELKVFAPEGWVAEYSRSVTLHHNTGAHDKDYVWKPLTFDSKNIKIKLTANDNVAAANYVYIVARAIGYPMPLIIPVTILG